MKFHRDLLQTRGNTKVQKLRFLQRIVWRVGSVCLPVTHFVVKNVNFSLLLYISAGKFTLEFAVELHETSHFFLNLVCKFIYGPYFTSNAILNMSGCFEKEPLPLPSGQDSQNMVGKHYIFDDQHHHFDMGGTLPSSLLPPPGSQEQTEGNTVKFL